MSCLILPLFSKMGFPPRGRSANQLNWNAAYSARCLPQSPWRSCSGSVLNYPWRVIAAPEGAHLSQTGFFPNFASGFRSRCYPFQVRFCRTRPRSPRFLEELAPDRRPQPVAKTDPGCEVRWWDRGHRQFCRVSSPSRRLTPQAITKIRR